MTELTAQTGIPARAVPFITRVCLKNYKSIAECDVRLGRLTILVGWHETTRRHSTSSTGM
jgi:hypothetical protein